MFGIRRFPKGAALNLSDLELEKIVEALDREPAEELEKRREYHTVREQILDYIKRTHPKARNREVSISHYAEFVLNVVEKACRYISANKQLHREVAPIITELKLKIVRQGLHDEKFFKESQHPARLLLDGIAGACTGSVGLEHDLLLRELASYIASLDNLVENSPQYLETLNEIMAKDNQHNQLVAQRVKTAIIGKLRSDEARDASEQAMSDLLEVYSVPEALTSLLKLWQNYLVLGYLDDKLERAAWNSLSDQLAEILGGFADTAQSKQVDWSVVERNRRRISYEANSVGISRTAQAQLIDNFDHIYKMIGAGKVVTFRKVLVKEKFHCAPDFDMNVAYSNELERVQSMKIGQWVEFSEPRQPDCRAQLVAQIPEAASLVFVQRKGPKIFEKHYSELAIGLETGVIKFVSDQAVFTQSLEQAVSVTGGQCGRLAAAVDGQAG